MDNGGQRTQLVGALGTLGGGEGIEALDLLGRVSDDGCDVGHRTNINMCQKGHHAVIDDGRAMGRREGLQAGFFGDFAQERLLWVFARVDAAGEESANVTRVKPFCRAPEPPIRAFEDHAHLTTPAVAGDLTSTRGIEGCAE